jgi:hypothetical protein
MSEQIWLLWNEAPIADVATILWTKESADRARRLGRRVEGPFNLDEVADAVVGAAMDVDKPEQPTERRSR